MEETPRLLTTSQAARELGVTPGRVRQLVADGTIRVTKVGSYNLIDARDLDALRTRKTTPGPAKGVRQGRGRVE